MNKESRIELQKIDCNCNDCKFMMRDSDKLNQSKEFHKKLQNDLFDGKVLRLRNKANWFKNNKGDLEKYNDLLVEADKMKFQFDKSNITINYGFCEELKKEISFIPNSLQLDTQKCFIHRRDIT